LSLAKVVVSGTVASEPEKRFTSNQNVAVSTFNLSVRSLSRPQAGSNGPSTEPFLVKVTCWRQLADAVTESLHKGDEVLVEGKLMVNSYQTPEGVAKKGYEIELASIDKLSGPAEPILVAAGSGKAENASYATTSTSSNGGGYATSPKTSSPVAAASSGGNPSSSLSFSEEMLTEDDIPF
jgi:single-strand DNA-binding protein